MLLVLVFSCTSRKTKERNVVARLGACIPKGLHSHSSWTFTHDQDTTSEAREDRSRISSAVKLILLVHRSPGVGESGKRRDGWIVVEVISTVNHHRLVRFL